MTRNRSDCSKPSGCKAGTGRKWLSLLVVGLSLAAVCVVIRCYWSAPPASAEPAAPDASASAAARPASADGAGQAAVLSVVAAVNTQRITREELGRECLRHFGRDVLESMVNKQLILLECRQRNVVVTQREVTADIEKMASRYKMSVEQWLKMSKQERNLSPDQYANDVVWPMLALRKLAGVEISVNRRELADEYEMLYGEAIRVRLIAVADNKLDKAKELHAKAKANPDNFGNLAKEFSEDAVSASLKGIIDPIRKHGSYDEVEQAVFAARDGEITPILHVAGQYVFLKREGAIAARPVPFEDAVPSLKEAIRQRKMYSASHEVFRKLQEQAAQRKAVQNVWNDPARQRQMPGVAATIYNARITIGELAEECIARHGLEVLEGMISRKILEQACKRQSLEVTDADIDAEITRAAAANVPNKPDGSPDVAAWLDLITKKQGLALDVYRHDVVWPSVALKELVGGKVQVTEADLRMGFEANYGPRVRCLAIVLNDLRRAQRAFESARANNTAEHFGDLAAEYSIEAGSRALRGEVPPIGMHGGQPEIEKEAFQLKPGELSGIIQIEGTDKFVILRCEGRTRPDSTITFDNPVVRDEIYQHIREKKLRLAMADRFEQLHDEATVDNYLAQTSHAPKAPAEPPRSARLPVIRKTSQ
jgi:parvulin-like peptidyl-prolyl isomerase